MTYGVTRTRSWIFYHLIYMNMQHCIFQSWFSFCFDWHDIFIFQRNVFCGSSFLLASNIHSPKLFSMKVNSHYWNSAAYTQKEKVWQKVTGDWWVSNIVILIFGIRANSLVTEIPWNVMNIKFIQLCFLYSSFNYFCKTFYHYHTCWSSGE